MVFPFPGPPDAPDVPEEGIVFQQIAGVRVHAGQGRAQIAEDTALVIVAEGGIQCGEDGGNHALLQNILGAGLVDRDVHSGKNQAHQGLILPHVRADQGDIPVAAALGNQGTHPVGCLHHLCPGGIRPADPQELGSAALLDRALEQLLPEDAQRVLPLGDLLHLHRNMQPLGSPVQLRGSLPRLLKGQLVGADAVAVQAHRNLRAELNQMLQNGHMLPGEIREAVNVKYVLPGKVPILQLLQQPGHLVPGVPLAPAAQAVVALHQQRELLQLLGQASLCLGGSGLQVRRADAAALEFVHPVDKLGEKFRLCLHCGIGLQPAGQLTGRRCHSHHPSAAVQALHGTAARLLRRSSGQAGEGQHLCIAAGGVTG